MRIAIIGSGVSGLVAAHQLGPRHDVTLFEADTRLGGHAHTVEVTEGERTLALDTGFLVFNPKTYPNFIRLLGELGVPFAESDMSFSVRSDRRNFEYSGRSLSSLYSQRRHLVSPRFHRMVWDIARFYREARALLESGDEIPLGEWLRSRRFSQPFVDDHLTPMIRAVWSARREVAEAFPARFLIRFFHNHGFLELGREPAWLTIPGGSQTYVREIAARFRGRIHTASPVRRVIRTGAGVVVEVAHRAPERFDHVVMACHADQALGLLGDPSSLERELLGAFPYQRNQAVLHTDERMMPRHRRVWASWNVHLDDEATDGACITYWLNSLQGLRTSTNYFVTLNRTAIIDPAKVLRMMEYSHPLFTVDGVRKQQRHDELIGHLDTSYCGAYWRNGFHEDGVVSALAVCRHLGCDVMERAA